MRKLIFPFIVCILIMSICAFADNDPNTGNRGAGYFSTNVEEYPELLPVYEDAGEPDIDASFDEKRMLARVKEIQYVKKNTDTIFVSERDFHLEGHRVILTHILVADPSTQVKCGLSNDEFGGEREKTSDFAKRTGAVVAVNGSYFYYETGEPIDICAPVVINDGKVLRYGNSNGSEVCLRFDGTFFSPHPGMAFSEKDLLQLGVVSNLGTADPLLISDGVPMSFPKDVKDFVYPRTGIGMVSAGEYYIITAGENGTYSGGLSYKQMQSIFYHLGCSYARSLDGGGSVTLVVNDEVQNISADGTERPVVDFLAFYE